MDHTDTSRGGNLAPHGSLALRVLPAPPPRPHVRTISDALRHGYPHLLQRPAARRWKTANVDNFNRSLTDMAAWERGRLRALGQLWARKIDADGKITDLGLVSCRVVTDAGVAFLVDAMQGLVEPELMRFHGVGTGTTAEAATQTALVTELTTQYATADTRPQGSLGEKAGDAKTFETSATITVSSSAAIAEHGLFTQAAVPGGVMLDRSVFAVVNLAAAEALQVTYQLTFPSGS